MIQIYNRKTNKYDTENVAGGKYIKWLMSHNSKSLLNYL